jgi:hypothetical protein
LRHRAMGCFRTYNGYNSMCESIASCVSMVCWPAFVDQDTNTKYACELWRAGARLNDNVRREQVAHNNAISTGRFLRNGSYAQTCESHVRARLLSSTAKLVCPNHTAPHCVCKLVRKILSHRCCWAMSLNMEVCWQPNIKPESPTHINR